jgi:WD40 repeat protein
MRWILIQEDNQGNKAITIDLTSKQSLLIGTDPQCDLVVDRVHYPSISRKHAVLEFEPSKDHIGSWSLRDNQSTNGTYVNGRRLVGSQLIMQDDTLTLSRDCFVLRLALVEEVSEHSRDPKDEQGYAVRGKENNASLNQMSRADNLPEGTLEVSGAGIIAKEHQTEAHISQEQARSRSRSPDSRTIGLQTQADSLREAPSETNPPRRSLSRSIRSEQSVTITTLAEAGAIEQESIITGSGVRALAVDSTTKRLIYSTSEITTIRQIGIGSPIYQQENDHKNPVSIIRFSKDGERIALGLRDKSICIMDCRLKQELHLCKGHRMALSDISFSPDGTHVASCGLDKTIRIWSLESGSEEKNMTYEGISIQSIDYAANGDFILAGGRDRMIRRINVAVLDEIEEVGSLSSGLELVRCSASGVVTTICSDRTVRIFKLEELTKPGMVARYADRKSIVGICNSSQLLAYVDEDSSVRLWTLD